MTERSGHSPPWRRGRHGRTCTEFNRRNTRVWGQRKEHLIAMNTVNGKSVRLMGEIPDKKNGQALKDSATHKLQQARSHSTNKSACSFSYRAWSTPAADSSSQHRSAFSHANRETPLLPPSPKRILIQKILQGSRNHWALQRQEAWGLRMEHSCPKREMTKNANSHSRMC